MPRLAASVWVNGAPEVVFRVLEVPTRPFLPPGAPRLVLVGPERELGARYRWEIRRLGMSFRIDSIVTEYEPGRRIAFKGVAGWTAEADADLKPEAGGTRLVFQMRYSFPAPLRWLIPGTLIRLGIYHTLEEIKAMSEEAGSNHAV
ncbi:MAG TPA: SRPBCC family protein [Symbiobacteriaceae bacterium]